MAVTENTYTGNGSTTNYSFTFPYLDTGDIKVTLNGTLTTAYTLANATTISFTSAPVNGATIRIYRDTDTTDLKATFFSGSAIRAQDLNSDLLQSLYATQESENEAFSATATANTALTNSATAVSTANTAVSTANSAVSTANTASTNASAAVATANTASTNASTAVSTANTASANATTAINTANSATTTANNAVTTANGAVSTANTALTNANSAVSTANTASTNASAAVSTANTASSNATSAVNTANTATTTANSAVNTANSAVSTANSAVTTANAAAAAVANAVLYTTVANVAAIPGSPSNNDAVEVTDSTGIESFTPLSGLPGGFVGSSGLAVRLIYQSVGSTWTWIQYFPNDPEARYLKFSGGTLTGQLRGDDSASASTPGFAFDGDANTGMGRPGADELALITGGTARLTIDPAGAVSIPGTLGVTGAITGSLTGSASNNVLKAGDTMTGALGVTAGTAGAPSVFISGDTNTGIYSPGADQVAISTGGSGRLFVDSSGNVGFGGTPKTWSSGALGALFNGSGSITAFSDEVSYGNNVYYNGAWRYARNDTAQLLQLGSGDVPLIFYSAATGTADASISWNERFRVDASGRLGVGTSSPSVRLQVQDSIAGGSDGTVATLHNFSDTGGDTRYVGLNFRIGSDNGTSAIRAARTSSAVDYRTELSFWTNPTGATQTPVRAMTIDHLQRVGIGTSSPSTTTEIRGSGNTVIASNGNLFVADGGTATQTAGEGGQISFGAWLNGDTSAPYAMAAIKGITESSTTNVNSGALLFGSRDTSSGIIERMRIDSSGRVGIGTTSPSFPVHSVNSSTSYIAAETTGTGTSAGFRLKGSASADYTIFTTQGVNQLAIYDNAASSERLRIDSSGRLLVGTSSAQGLGRIQVEGDADGAKLYLRRNITNSAMTTSGQVVLGSIDFGNIDGAVGARIQANNDTDSGWANNDYPTRLVFSTTADGASSPTERMRISSAGAVEFRNGGIYAFNSAIASGAGTNTLKYNTGTGIFTYDVSTRLIKENIVDCPYGIDAVKQLKPRKYFRIDDQADEIGFIADEVVSVMPEFVPAGPKSIITRNEEDTEVIPLGVNYDKITAVLTKALQEAITKIETLEARLTAAGIE